MGSQSDWATMKHAAETLDRLGIAHDDRIVSAHRTPKRLYDFATAARQNGFKVIIAGAGGAAHLPGMAASMMCTKILYTPGPILSIRPTMFAGGWQSARSFRAGSQRRPGTPSLTLPARITRRCNPPDDVRFGAGRPAPPKPARQSINPCNRE